MRIPVFLSYPKPIAKSQEEFVATLRSELSAHGLDALTLGVTDYDMDAPLQGIRRLMIDSNGLLAIAFRRMHIRDATLHGDKEVPIENEWLTSPWPHIETAMAYQLGLPVLLLKEPGVRSEGVFERGVVGLFATEVPMDDGGAEFFKSQQWKQLLGQWEGHVRKVLENKAEPPRRY